MGRLVVALDPAVGVGAEELAAAWDADAEARAAGTASVEASVRGEFLPDVLTLVAIPLTLVAIPLAVNLASTAVCAMVSRLVGKLRSGAAVQPDLEVVELTTGEGDRVVVVRIREARS